MILTGTMIAAAAGYIVNEIKKSKGAKQAADELSTGIWEWIRPVFLKDDEKLVEDLENTPDEIRPILEYQIKRKAQTDENFDKELAKLVKGAVAKGISSNSITVTGDNNQVFQDIKDSEINVTKIDRQINQGDGSTYNENK